jgi:hypothetical protein
MWCSKNFIVQKHIPYILIVFVEVCNLWSCMSCSCLPSPATFNCFPLRCVHTSASSATHLMWHQVSPCEQGLWRVVSTKGGWRVLRCRTEIIFVWKLVSCNVNSDLKGIILCYKRKVWWGKRLWCILNVNLAKMRLIKCLQINFV